MVKNKIAILVLVIISAFFSACGGTEDFEVKFYRKVARETLDNGWVYTFVNDGLKDENADDSDLIKYSFFGINLRYKYDDNYVRKVVHEPESPDKGKPFTEIIIPPCLLLGDGSEAEKRDMQLIDTILDYKNKSVEDLLALNPDDYEFEVIDKAMFFRLMKTALTSEPQKEGNDQAYWDKPTYAFYTEPTYLSGYKFQIAFLQETGCVDELYIDVLYQTGDDYKDYVQLSDLVDNQTATAEQKQVFDNIVKIVADIKENENFIVNAAEYKDKKIGEVDFSRLYNFLNNIHKNNFKVYNEEPRTQIIEGIEQ